MQHEDRDQRKRAEPEPGAERAGRIRRPEPFELPPQRSPSTHSRQIPRGLARITALDGAHRVGVFVGTSTAGILETELAYQRRDPHSGALPAGFRYAHTHNPYSPSAFVRAYFALRGPAMSISSACSSGAKAFGSARRMLEDLGRLRDRDGTTVVMVTHDHEVERHVDRVLRIRDGRTSTETRADTGELLIVDAAGRLQIPRSVRQEANLGARVRVRVENGRVIIENEQFVGRAGAGAFIKRSARS